MLHQTNLLRAVAGWVVVSFIGVVALLAIKGELNFREILAGMIPNFDQWNQPAGRLGLGQCAARRRP